MSKCIDKSKHLYIYKEYKYFTPSDGHFAKKKATQKVLRFMRRDGRSLRGRPNFRHCFLNLLKQEVITKHPSEESDSSKYQYFLKKSAILLYVGTVNKILIL